MACRFASSVGECRVKMVWYGMVPLLPPGPQSLRPGGGSWIGRQQSQNRSAAPLAWTATRSATRVSVGALVTRHRHRHRVSVGALVTRGRAVCGDGVGCACTAASRACDTEGRRRLGVTPPSIAERTTSHYCSGSSRPRGAGAAAMDDSRDPSPGADEHKQGLGGETIDQRRAVR
jgi:hypothetical protein